MNFLIAFENKHPQFIMGQQYMLKDPNYIMVKNKKGQRSTFQQNKIFSGYPNFFDQSNFENSYIKYILMNRNTYICSYDEIFMTFHIL